MVGKLHNLPLLCPQIDHLFRTAVDLIVLELIDEVDPDLYFYRVLHEDRCRRVDFNDDEEGW